MAQTGVYPAEADRGLPGLLDGVGHKIASLAIETADVEWGRGVEAGTDPETQAVAYAGGALAGVLVRTQTPDDATLEADFEGARVGELAGGTCYEGRLWVKTNEAVVAGDSVFCVNTGADAGLFRNDATNATAVPQAAFRAYDANRGVALLELNLPA